MPSVGFRRYYLKRNIHVSWLIAAGSLVIFIGIVVVPYLPLGTFNSSAWLLLGLLFGFIALWRHRVWTIGLMIVAGLCIGLWRGSVQSGALSYYTQLYGRTTTVKGNVSEDTDVNKRGQLVLRLGDIQVNETKLAGKIWVTIANDRRIQRSDRITISGKIQEGFGNFSASMYSARLVAIQRAEPGDIALKIRNWFAENVAKSTNEPQTSLGLGYVVGQRRGLPEELDAALKTAGLTHIVVASGYNLTILVRLARRLFEKISKYLAFLFGAGMILSFIAITGMSPSMSRAGLVAGLALIAWYYGRKFHPLVLLPFSIAITVLINPSYAWGDIGWELSFAAFAGVMILAPLMNAYFFGDKPEKPIGRILVETIAAQVCTLPILLVAFGQISVIAPLANIIILPLVPLAMLLTFVAGLGGIVAPGIAHIIGFPAEIILSYMTQTIQFVGKLPWALQEIQLSSFGGAIFYGLLFLIAVYMWRKTRLNLRDTSIVE